MSPQDSFTSVESEKASKASSFKSAGRLSVSENPSGKVSETRSDTCIYNNINLNTSDGDEKITPSKSKQSDTNTQNNSPLSDRSYTGSMTTQPPNLKDLENMIAGSLKFFTSIPKILSMIANNDKTNTSARPSATSIASESDENIINRLID